MLGPPKPRHIAEPITVSLETLVPRHDFHRDLEANLNLGFVREWVQELYAERGRPSIDPVVFLKLQLIMFFEGIRSERKVIETASLHLAHRWYLGYALDENLPDHSSLTRIRQRLGIDVFQRFFEQVVDLCQEAGLVWGRELYFGATKVEANAGIPSLIPRFYYDATMHVADLFTDEAEDNAPHDTDLPPDIVALPIDAESVVPAGDPPWRLLEERRLDPRRPSHRGYRRTSDFRVSPTDPDASPMWDWGAIRLGYHDHYVVDGGKRRTILAALVTAADVMESQAMRDEYRCPQGHSLRRYAVKRTEEVVAYRGEAALCNACPVKAQCTTSDHGRKVQRSFYIDYLEKVRGYHATEAYKKAIRKRQDWVEPMFAEAKEWHGLRRLRLRGLMNAKIQGLLIAAGQNLKRFLAPTGWGRRNAPCRSIVALLVVQAKSGAMQSGRTRPTVADLAMRRLSPVDNGRGRLRASRCPGCQ